MSRRCTRRRFLGSMAAAGAGVFIVPARVLGAEAPSSKLNVAVIGAGAQGRGDMTNFLAADDVRVTALCDVNRKNIDLARAQIAKAYGSADVKVVSDFRQISGDGTIDAVLMALPVHWHCIISTDVILRGKHIYHEKPMGLSLEEGQITRAAVKKTCVVFQFGTQQRSDMKFRWASELALNGRLGKLKEIHVSVPPGKAGPSWPEQPIPQGLDWDRWVGPAPATPFHADKLKRDNHENMSAFSLGMISCWGIHHIDIAQWGNGTDATGPRTIEGAGEFPKEGSLDAITKWDVRMEFANAAPVRFVNDGTPGFSHGIKFVGEDAWVHVARGTIKTGDEAILRDPQNKCGTMPTKLPASVHHVRNFLDAIKNKTRALCDIETAVRNDTLCQLSLIAAKAGKKLEWDPAAEKFVGDDSANAMLKARAPRGEWKLPVV